MPIGDQGLDVLTAISQKFLTLNKLSENVRILVRIITV